MDQKHGILVNSVLNSWNISIRKALNLPYITHRYLLPVIVGHNPQDMIVFIRFYQYIKACPEVQMNM